MLRRSERLVGPSALGQLDPEARALKRDLQAHLVEVSHRQWLGHGETASNGAPPSQVNITSSRYIATDRDRATIQEAGRVYGCHTCRTDISIDTNQPWTGDHIPPKELSAAAVGAIFGAPAAAGAGAAASGAGGSAPWSGQTMLLAQCDVCAAKQSVLVKELNKAADPAAVYDALPASDKALITGGRQPNIVSHGTKVSAGEGVFVQAEGAALGCHSCPSKTPSGIYHADHLPPAEFMTAYMPEVCRVLGIDARLLDAPVLRPQCKRCSAKQGGDLSALTARVLSFANRVGIRTFKWDRRSGPYR